MTILLKTREIPENSSKIDTDRLHINTIIIYHADPTMSIKSWKDIEMKYTDIIQSIKNDRIAAAVATAAQLYLSVGISEAKMTDIAEQAQIGVASLYRYFGTKQLFTVKVAAYIWKTTLQEVESLYTGPDYDCLTGLEQVKAFLNVFRVLMEEHKNFLRFLSEFDMFVVWERLNQEQLKEYETCSLNTMPVVIQAMEKGKADGTIRSDVDPNLYYHTVTDCLISMCQRFAQGNVPHTEDSERNLQSLNMTIDMFVAYLQEK